jgi:hypothetical protein
MRTIAHFMVASRQALDDAASLQSLIDADSRSGLAFAEVVELLTGEHLLGIAREAGANDAAANRRGPATAPRTRRPCTLLPARSKAIR